jgi:hypothetical protein
MNEEGMLKPALTGGVLLGILSATPYIEIFNCACCAWVIAGGLLAAYQYVKSSTTPVTLGRGLQLGFWTGAIGAIAYFLLNIPIYVIRHRSGINLMDEMQQNLNRFPILQTAESRDFIQRLSAQGHLFLWFIVSMLVFTFVIYCIFAMVGGSIGVALFEKRKTGAPPEEDTLSQTPPME